VVRGERWDVVIVGKARSDSACGDGGGDQCCGRFKTKRILESRLDSIEENQN